MQKLEENSSPYAVMIAMIMYSICSSTLLLANKLALVHLPSPSLVSFIQIVFSTIQVLVMKYVFRVKVDELEWHKMKLYMIFIATFVASLYANMKTLSLSNIETVIVFRACTPVLCTILEYIFMDRALPSIRSAIALIIVSAGAIMYCQADSEFSLRGLSAYWWGTCIIYY
jgi:drug/metabolite transporter (DMT)-like permease